MRFEIIYADGYIIDTYINRLFKPMAADDKKQQEMK
mgnify:CR=1 FL=1